MAGNLAYIGTALAYPLQLQNGSGVVVGGLPVLNQSIVDILTTPIGSRLFLRDYGSRMDELIFEPNDEILLGMARTFVQDALETWETRVEYVDLSFEVDPDTPDMLLFTCQAVNKQSNDIESFVFPFYRQLAT